MTAFGVIKRKRSEIRAVIDRAYRSPARHFFDDLRKFMSVNPSLYKRLSIRNQL
jgi:hypothetical protein